MRWADEDPVEWEGVSIAAIATSFQWNFDAGWPSPVRTRGNVADVLGDFEFSLAYDPFTQLVAIRDREGDLFWEVPAELLVHQMQVLVRAFTLDALERIPSLFERRDLEVLSHGLTPQHPPESPA
jgi:hypothetical protein